jgi:hypothetical protein
VSAAWIDRHFELIEAAAPRLERLGREVGDYCRGSARPPGLNPGFGASAQCTRSVLVVYGYDGQLMPMLDVLGEALFAAGWGRLRNSGRGSRPVEQSWVALTGQELLSRRSDGVGALTVPPQWRPNDALGFPAGMDGTPPWGRVPLSPRMQVSCGETSTERRALPTGHMASAQRAPRNYLLLENEELPDGAQRNPEHTVAVTISLNYYTNPNAKARPHQIPRYWRPTKARW